MYAIDKPTPSGCADCPEFVRYQIAYDEQIGCVHGASKDGKRRDRPPACPLTDLEDDLK